MYIFQCRVKWGCTVTSLYFCYRIKGTRPNLIYNHVEKLIRFTQKILILKDVVRHTLSHCDLKRLK